MEVTKHTDASEDQKKTKEEEQLQKDFDRLTDRLRDEIRSSIEPDPSLWYSIPQRFLRCCVVRCLHKENKQILILHPGQEKIMNTVFGSVTSMFFIWICLHDRMCFGITENTTSANCETRAEDRIFYILVGIAAALVVIIILGIALVLLYYGLRKSDHHRYKTELKNSEMISKMEKGEEEMIRMIQLLTRMEEKGMQDLDKTVRDALESIKTNMPDKDFDREEDKLSYIWNMLKPVIAAYMPSWFS